MAGHTYDNSLSGINIWVGSLPYLAMQSISFAGKTYWAKAFSNKISQSMYAVQFSTDGSLLISHSYFSNKCFIVIINTSSGDIITARRYFNGGYYNYNYLIKSMLVSSNESAKAYVLSNY